MGVELPVQYKSGVEDIVFRLAYEDFMSDADYKLKKDGPSVSATLRTLFYTLPRLLIVHLSRFTYTATGQGKVHKRVQFDAHMK